MEQARGLYRSFHGGQARSVWSLPQRLPTASPFVARAAARADRVGWVEFFTRPNNNGVALADVGSRRLDPTYGFRARGGPCRGRTRTSVVQPPSAMRRASARP